jgi:hypothetical protein
MTNVATSANYGDLETGHEERRKRETETGQGLVMGEKCFKKRG